MASFKKLLIYIIYIPIYINTTCLVCVMLLICTFSWLTIWYRITNWCALPRGDYFSISECSLVVCRSLCREETLQRFPIHVSVSIVVILVQEAMLVRLP